MKSRSDLLGGAASTTEVLLQRAEDGDSTPHYFGLPAQQGGEVRTLSFPELVRKASGVAAELGTRLQPGDRALVIHDDPLEFVVGMVACLLSGTMAVPAYPPQTSRLRLTGPRLEAICRDADVSLVLCTSAQRAMAAPLGAEAPTLSAIPWLATAEVPESDHVTLHNADIAYLQYTSGSTGRPRGVMVGHEHLVSYGRTAVDVFYNQDVDTWVLWLPLFHDMGLLCGVFSPMWGGGRTVLMTPMSFLVNPVRWLQAMTEYNGTGTAAPNFAFDLCVHRVTEEERAQLDLSSMVHAVNGAEPIRAATMQRFNEAFAPAGLKPTVLQGGYGMAESTLAIAAGRPQRGVPASMEADPVALRGGRLVPATGGRPLVSSGPVMEGLTVKVVDVEALVGLPDGRVGEVWVSGPWICGGYWRLPEETEATFRAQLPGDSRFYLRTGDLGAVVDGEVYITGRAKDILVIHGSNYYPHDIEAAVESASPLVRKGCVVASAYEEGDEERLLVLAEVREPVTGDELEQLIIRTVATREGIRPGAVALLEPGQLPKTSSGKIMRSAARDAWLARREGSPVS